MAKRKKKEYASCQDSSGVRGIARREHFESGGSLVEWRGIHVVHNSQRKNTRGSRRRKAIRDSEDS